MPGFSRIFLAMAALCVMISPVEGFPKVFSAGTTIRRLAEPGSCSRRLSLGRMWMAHLEQRRQQGGLLEAQEGGVMEKSMGNARRKFVGNGILAVLSSVSIARPAMGEASPIAAEGKQPYLRETLKLIDGGDLQMAEQRLTKSIGAWNDSAVDLTVLLKVRRKPQTMIWQETNNL